MFVHVCPCLLRELIKDCPYWFWSFALIANIALLSCYCCLDSLWVCLIDGPTLSCQWPAGDARHIERGSLINLLCPFLPLSVDSLWSFIRRQSLHWHSSLYVHNFSHALFVESLLNVFVFVAAFTWWGRELKCTENRREISNGFLIYDFFVNSVGFCLFEWFVRRLEFDKQATG